MNQNNLDYLKNGLKYLGFGDKLNDELENGIKKEKDRFQIQAVGQFKDAEVTYKLDFSRSQQTDMYFFNRYTASMKHKEDPERNKEQTFYVSKNAGITAKEAYNLLSGRAVNKKLVTAEEKPYNAWVQIDFTEKDKHNNYKLRQFTSNYGYELDKTLEKYPIKEMADPELKEKMLRSLEKGNLHQVTFQREGEEEKKMYISANPQFKSLNLYDQEMKKVFQENQKKVQPEPAVRLKEPNNIEKQQAEKQPEQKKKAEKKESLSDNDEGPAKKKRSRKKSLTP